MSIIHIEELPGCPDVPDVLRCFESEKFAVVFDSATCSRRSDTRYSFLTADPVEVSVIPDCACGDDPFVQLRAWQQRLPFPDGGECPPFCGGIAGLMSYELGHAFERLPRAPWNEFATPALAAGLFDWAIVWDHLESAVRLYVIPLVESAGDGNEQQQQRIDWVRRRLPSRILTSTAGRFDVPSASGRAVSAGAGPTASNAVGPAGGSPSGCSRDEYCRAVDRVIEYIRAGDIFQANLSQQLRASWCGSSADLFRSVRHHNPAPFSGFLQTPDFAVISASPERFLKVSRGRHVETRPIKGTRRRLRSPIADLFTADELAASHKDRAENVMIVDLLRNDISRVCRTGTVRVTGVCEIEVFETVQHLVSTVVGELRNDRDVWDLCAVCFPGGSVTGAPKIRAMEIITEMEQTARGAYCGSLFCCGPSGCFDSNILIRTFTLKDGHVQFPVGGGIVADSVPQEEYDETLHKATGMILALRESAAKVTVPPADA